MANKNKTKFIQQIQPIILRLWKVLYILLVLVGIYIAYLESVDSAPYTEVTSTSIVYCENGKSFDPGSKPIFPNGDEPNPPRYGDIRHRQISSECEYGTSYYVGNSVPHPKNYREEVTEHSTTKGSLWEQAIVFLVVFGFYMLILESVRRVIRYIFTGKNLLKNN